MNNPFDYIKQDREKRYQEEELKRAEANRIEQERILATRQKFDSMIAPYENMVLKVLNDLQQAVYPEDEIGSIHGYESGKITKWSLGKTKYYLIDGGVDTSSSYSPSIDITLEFGRDGKPKSFICKRYDIRNEDKKTIQNELRAELSFESLVNTIVRLYPSGT